MPKINLITERRRREKRQLLLARVLLYGCYASFIAFLGIFSWSLGAGYRKNADIEALSSQLRTLQSALATEKQVQTAIGVLDPKLKLLRAAKDSTFHWYLIYQQIGQAMPKTSWLDNLAIQKSDKGEQLALSGQSLSQDTVADTLEQLQNYPAYSSVTLQSITHSSPSEERKPGIHPVRFEMTVQLKPSQDSPNAHASAQNKS